MKKINAFLTLLFSLALPALAQTGKITGKVTDKKTGETLIGLTAKLEGLAKGASTNVDGRYTLTAIPPGKYSLTFTYLGYATKKVSDIDVKANETATLDVVMEEAASAVLAEVIITTSARQESVNSLYAAQKNNAGISDGISAETIRRSPDRNTSEVLKRVSGTTIQDNKFVIVRGLSDRYNTAQIDNSSLPSTEPNRKAFSFDIIPSNLVDNIVISKTATPDMSGDFAGGSIKIVTRDIPTQNFVSLAAGATYNTQSTFKTFKSGYRNVSDYFGFDNGARAIPSGFPSTSRVLAGLTADQNIAAIRKLNSSYNISNANGMPGQNYQLSLGRVMDLGKNGNRLGAVLSLTYRNTQQANEVERDYFVFDYNDNQYKFSTNVGAVANFAYNFGSSKITFKNLYNRVFDDQLTLRTGTNTATSTDNRFYAFDLIEKSLIKSTLEGEHRLGKSGKIKWTGGYSNVINDQPDQRKTSYSKNLSDLNNPNIGYTANVISIGKENTRLFSYLDENIYTGELSTTLPINFFKRTGTMKAGVSTQYRDRSFDVRFIGLLLNPFATDANAIRQRPIRNLFGRDLIAQNVYKLDEIANATDRYAANSMTNAAYLMFDTKFGKSSRLVWGARVEKFDLKLKTFDPAQPQVELHNTDVLPSANYTLALNPKSNFRVSYYRSLARPEFREIAPFSYYDYEFLATQKGDPSLQRAIIDNADIRYEIYPSAGQIFSVSVFYKRFKDAIEPYINDINSTPDISYFNADKATTYGAELEFRRNLDFISPAGFFDNTTFYSNVSIIKSEVKDPLVIGNERPMVGQSPYTVNLGLTHTAMQDNLSINLLYNRIGRRIYKANGSVFPSVWDNPRDVVDFQVGLKLLRKKADLRLNASDLLNQSYVYYFDYDVNKKYERGGADETISRYKTGRSFTLSLSYTFDKAR